MAVKEKRAVRNGIPVPIQCITQRRKYDSPTNTLFHYHDYMELLYGVSGDTTAFVGTEVYSLVAGSMILVPSEVAHHVRAYGEESVHIVVKFSPSVLFSEEQTIAEYSYARLLLRATEMGKLFFTAEEISDLPLSALFSHIKSEWDNARFGYEFALRSDVIGIMLHIMRLWEKEKPTLSTLSVTEEQTHLLTQAISYIKENYRDFNEQTCAQMLGVSSAHLSRVFKKGMGGISFSNYLVGVKLKEAEKLLVSTDTPITEIALDVGFSTASHFISAFRKRYRMTPAHYRKFLHGQYIE